MSSSTVKRTFAIALGGVLMCTAVADVGADAPARRLAGSTRYETAVAVALAAFPTATDVVIARGDLFPDALAGSYFARVTTSPLLLVPPDGPVPAAVLAALAHLREGGGLRLKIVGDTSAVSASVEAQLLAAAGLGAPSYRTAGADRYATAAFIALSTAEPTSLVFLTSGETYPDALAVGPASYELEAPVLLTRRDSLPEWTATAIDRYTRPDRVVIVGGTAVVSAAVEAEVTVLCGCAVERVAGANRQETATRLADWLVARYPARFDLSHVNLTRGDNFPDALALGPHGGREGAVTVFTNSATELGAVTTQWLRAHATEILSLDLIGDETAIDSNTAQAAIAASS